ncbi:MAG: Fe-S oxidoreductase [Proteobacteria bacterium]|nr:MAG: Fe-S oxidoreductase [Pseudomonadota bacterium]
MIVGRVAQIWRHPVKSMEGERLARTEVGVRGLPGDRAWAVRDEVRGGIRGAKKLPGLMRCRARYAGEPAASAPEIELPDGTCVRADAPDAAARVGAAVEAKVSLWPLLPETALDHYRRGAPDHEDVLTELRAIFGREEGEPLPDLSLFPPDVIQYESPPGTYFDAYPILLLTDATLRRLAQLAPASRIDVRRFRPNFLVETAGGGDGFPELGWRGRRVRVGGALLDAVAPCPRCVMITHGFADLPRDPALMRVVVREADQNVGVYANVTAPGAVQVGDPVELVDA